MDDLDPERAKMLAQHLKLWTDRYGVCLETKGGATSDKWTKFVITSQYSLPECFDYDSKTLEAMQRRFEVIHIPLII